MLGSPRVTTNSFGEVTARRDFLPFGEELYAGLVGRNANQKYSSSADDTRKKFATYQRDAETGLDFAQSRDYSPMHGRFTSPDEFKGGPNELFDFEEDATTEDQPTNNTESRSRRDTRSHLGIVTSFRQTRTGPRLRQPRPMRRWDGLSRPGGATGGGLRSRRSRVQLCPHRGAATRLRQAR
jgi:RHS repeat-associated protein